MGRAASASRACLSTWPSSCASRAGGRVSSTARNRRQAASSSAGRRWTSGSGTATTMACCSCWTMPRTARTSWWSWPDGSPSDGKRHPPDPPRPPRPQRRRMVGAAGRGASRARPHHATRGRAADVTELPVIPGPRQRRDLFAAARDAFAPVLAAQGYTPPAGDPPAERLQRLDTNDDFERPLAVQMEALLWLASAAPARARPASTSCSTGSSAWSGRTGRSCWAHSTKKASATSPAASARSRSCRASNSRPPPNGC